jgi:hypothetical protein
MSDFRSLHDLAYSIPTWPPGHVNNQVAEGLHNWSNEPLIYVQDIIEVQQLIARAHYLIKHPPPGFGPPSGGGTPVAIRRAV